MLSQVKPSDVESSHITIQNCVKKTSSDVELSSVELTADRLRWLQLSEVEISAKMVKCRRISPSPIETSKLDGLNGQRNYKVKNCLKKPLPVLEMSVAKLWQTIQ